MYSIKLKQTLAGCNIWNSLHETKEKYQNLNSIKSQLHYYQAPYYRCRYVVNFVHEYLVETDSHLQISQSPASLKQENVTVSYHSYTTSLSQNILQLQLHFTYTLYSINNLRFTKFRVSWNGGLLHVPNCEMFLTLPKFECGCLNWPKFDLAVVIFPNIYNICKSEWNSSNLTRWFQLHQVWMKLFNSQIWLRVLKFALMFLILCKFRWSRCILPKWEQSCLKFPKNE